MVFVFVRRKKKVMKVITLAVAITAITQMDTSLSFSWMSSSSPVFGCTSTSSSHHNHHSCDSWGLHKSRIQNNIKSSSSLFLSPIPVGSNEEQERNDEDGVSGRTKIEGEEEENDEESFLRFQGVSRLYSHEQQQQNSSSSSASYNQVFNRLQKSTVAIIGIGGVGSWAAESICRSGVGNIILVDLDDICISNTNRQLHATSSSVGKLKNTVMKERLLDINPKCNVTLIHDFITEDNVFDIVESFQKNTHESSCNHNNGNKNELGQSRGGGPWGVDVIIDAIDGNTEKAALIAAACIKDIPIVTCGGAAGRIDPSQIVCQDLSQSVECKLLFWTKKKLRNHYRLFPNDDITKKKKNKRGRKWRIPAVYSTEIQKKVEDDNSSSFRKCDGALGTACFVTGTYGMIAASQAVTMIAKDSFAKPRLIRSSVNYWNELHEKTKQKGHEGGSIKATGKAAKMML